MNCRICGNGAYNRVLVAREMMFGLGGSFQYLACAGCGAVQLIDPPEDLNRFYPSNYYSFDNRLPRFDAPAVAVVKRVRTAVLLRMPVRMVGLLVRSRRIPPQFLWFAGLGVSATSSVCDVGSGDGHTLIWMLRQGFTTLAGFDPYIDQDRTLTRNVFVYRRELDQIPGMWDLIMLNHSFEHMARPAAVLRSLRDHLSFHGRILVRVPVADSWAFRTYGPDWVQLDAPRHFFIHTRRSMQLLAEQVGLSLERVFFDSYALQFWGSEQYKHGIPLRDPRSWAERSDSALFTADDIQKFEKWAVKLNQLGAGDSAGFVLKRADAV